MPARHPLTPVVKVMTPWAVEQARMRLDSQERVMFSLLLQRGQLVFASSAVHDRWWHTWSAGLDAVPVQVALQAGGLAKVQASLDAIVWGWP